MNDYRPILLIMLLLIFIIFKAPSQASAADELEAKEAITNTENLLLNCYNASLEAEKAGANITQLLTILNEAGTFLSKAELAYKNGNFTSAVEFTNQTQTRLNGFADLARSAREMGLQQTYWDFMIYIVASIAGSIAIIFGSLIVWFFLKRRYGSVTE